MCFGIKEEQIFLVFLIVSLALSNTMLIGCHNDKERVGHAAELAEQHLSIFTEFDKWARRAGVADSVLRNEDALVEAVFAPIRRRESILAAWIEFRGRHTRILSLPRKLVIPEHLVWVNVRHEELGTLRVSSQDICPLKVSSRLRNTRGGGCVIISRRAPVQNLTDVVVTVAFRKGLE